MFKNKHIIVAMIVAPILAVIAYLATDSLVGEKPHKAEEGQSYSLVALPNCRYPSGHCTMKNSGFQLDIQITQAGANLLSLNLTSLHPLQGAKVAIVGNTDEMVAPTDMSATDDTARNWTVDVSGAIHPQSRLQLVAAAGGAFYFGEAGLTFIDYETAFGKDFRHHEE